MARTKVKAKSGLTMAVLQKAAVAVIILKRELDPTKKKFKLLKKGLISMMHQMKINEVSTDLGDISVSDGTRENFDMKKFKVDYPDLYIQYLKTTPVSSLKIGKEDGEEDED